MQFALGKTRFFNWVLPLCLNALIFLNKSIIMPNPIWDKYVFCANLPKN
ncbi:hypothetical protein [Moraxella lacunata]